jgi:hypothetical protein
MKTIVKILFSLLALPSIGHAEPRLVAIFNKLDAIKFSVKIDNKNVAPTVTTSEFFKLSKLLPAEVVVSQKGREQSYVISITQGANSQVCGMGGRGLQTPVDASVKPYAGKQTICLNQASRRYLVTRAGTQHTYNWESVALIISPNYKATDTNGQLPFVYEIIPWTSSNSPWNNPQITKIPDTATKFTQPLRVLQGLPAWGGGILPLPQHANIAHIYNDSPHMILITRSIDTINSRLSSEKSLAVHNFQYILPPYTAVPLAMVWVPRVAEQEMKYEGKSAIRIYTIGIPIGEQDLPPDALDLVSKAGKQELPFDTASVQASLQELPEVSSLTSQITGLSNYSALLQPDYFAYQTFFTIFNQANSANKVHIDRCHPLNDPTCSQSYVSTQQAFASGSIVPNYFQLLIQQAPAGSPDPTTLILMPISSEEVR